MRKFRLTALILAAAMAVTPLVGCSSSSSASSSSSTNYKIYERNDLIASSEVKGEANKEVEANQTVFKLNKVIDAASLTDENEHYLYFDITINNSTDTEYELSTLNNFYILLPDNREMSAAIRTQVFAIQNFDDTKYFQSPFTVPANSSFSGIVGGFVIPEDPKKGFTLAFFPTREDARDKETVIKVNVTEKDVIEVPSDLLKK